MRVLLTVILAGTTLLLLGGTGAGQEQTADSISCAMWLQWAESAKRVRPGESVQVPSTSEELRQLIGRLADGYSAQGIRRGYAIGIFATAPTSPRSHIRGTEEFVTALDALCAGAPHKRLLDVALHALGRR